MSKTLFVDGRSTSLWHRVLSVLNLAASVTTADRASVRRTSCINTPRVWPCNVRAERYEKERKGVHTIIPDVEKKLGAEKAES